jgi:mono/diheme cytochrome c family protein
VFAHSCQSCHSLVGNESRHKQGGDLLGYNLTRAQLTSFTRVMPARLTAAQLRAVVDYVYRVQQSRGKGLLGITGG